MASRHPPDGAIVDPLTGRVLRSPEEREAAVQEARNEAIELNHKYNAVFSRGAGADVLADLEAQFDRNVLVPGDPYHTHAMIGMRQVIDYIHERMRIPADGD